MQYGISYTKQSPTAETVGDSGLDIKVYPNVLPFVNFAFTAQAVHVRFRIFVSYKECRKQQVISVPVHGCRACCSTNSDIPTLGMASKFSKFCLYLFLTCVFTGVARRFWRCARRHLHMSELTLVWSKVRNTGNYSVKTQLKY